MKKQLQGIAFILFGILLALAGVANNTWVPMMDHSIGEIFSLILLWLGLILGIIGLAFSLSKNNGDK